MRFAIALLSALLLPLSAAAQHFHQSHNAEAAEQGQFRRSPCDKRYTRPVSNKDLQKVPWDVPAKNQAAKDYFNQGMTLYYGFNFEEAARAFKAALEEDKDMAMAAWGVALASGPNININMQGKCAEQAVDYSKQAVTLAKTQPGITDREKLLIKAMADRYANGLDAVAYSTELRHLWNGDEKAGRVDPNLVALFTESLMDLRPWGLFDNAHRPALDTTQLIAALESAVKKDKSSVGANHLYIHAVEAGPTPETAQDEADRLAGLVPKSGHLVHMPSHIHQLTGNFAAAVDDNTAAIDVDFRQYSDLCAGSFEKYWANPDCPAVYYGHYLGHNHFFRSVAAAFAGQRGNALVSALATREHVKDFVVNEPGLQRYMTAPLMMLAAHQQWEDVLNQPEPPKGCYAQEPFPEDTGCHLIRATRWYARGMAHAYQRQRDLAIADSKAMADEMAKIAPPTPTGWGNNTAAAVLAVPSELLLARIAWAADKRDEAIEHLKLAVTHEDAMVYDEPPQWFAPAREALGGAYLHTGRYADARDTFLDELHEHRDSGRALYGLWRAYVGLGEEAFARQTKARFDRAWKTADYEMSDQKLW